MIKMGKFAEFSQMLRRYRTQKRLTQKEVSEKGGIKQTSYSRYERGKHLPSRTMLDKLSSALQLDSFQRTNLFHEAGYSVVFKGFGSPLRPNKGKRAESKEFSIIPFDVGNQTIQKVAATIFDQNILPEAREKLEEQIQIFVEFLRENIIKQQEKEK